MFRNLPKKSVPLPSQESRHGWVMGVSWNGIDAVQEKNIIFNLSQWAHEHWTKWHRGLVMTWTSAVSSFIANCHSNDTRDLSWISMVPIMLHNACSRVTQHLPSELHQSTPSPLSFSTGYLNRRKHWIIKLLNRMWWNGTHSI